MSLAEATANLLTAVESGNLQRITDALDMRAAAIASTAAPSAKDIQDGERVQFALQALKQSWIHENARLAQMRAGFGSATPEQRVDFSG